LLDNYDDDGTIDDYNDDDPLEDYNNQKFFLNQNLFNKNDENNVKSNKSTENIVYNIVKQPEHGKIQYIFENFYEDLTGPNSYTNKFTQNDIDQGIFLQKFAYYRLHRVDLLLF
jgi:hypothetical protein